MSEIQFNRPIWCVHVGTKWCAVLGNYPPDQTEGLTQRLCDQRLVPYADRAQSIPDCEDCKRIRKLMLELTPVYPEDLDDE